MILNGRTYRPIEPSDYPKALLGKLVLFYYPEYEKYRGSAKLVGTKFGSGHGTGFVVSCNDNTELFVPSPTAIYVDVTSEKRYAIWNHKAQRFPLAKTDIFKDRVSAQLFCDKMQKQYNRDTFYVVEWEIKEDAE
jgi:hypothetical protein